MSGGVRICGRSEVGEGLDAAEVAGGAVEAGS